MGIIIAVILADVLVFLLFVYQYRQEMGLTVNGEHDLPVVRKKPVKKQIARTGTAVGQANRGRPVART
jgi:hypothetical protein